MKYADLFLASSYRHWARAAQLGHCNIVHVYSRSYASRERSTWFSAQLTNASSDPEIVPAATAVLLLRTYVSSQRCRSKAS